MPGFAASFLSGFLHPLHGADHLVAMLAVGIWGGLAGGRAIRIWPIAFVAAMLLGFATATTAISVPLVEPAVMSSVIVLGLLVALAVEAPVWLGAGIIGLFAFFHGHVHGTEAAAASFTAYGAGLAVATGALHTAGILCCLTGGPFGRLVLRTMGAVTALGGLLAMLVLK